MTRSEVIAILRPWHERTVELQCQWDALRDLTGASTESPLAAAIWDVHDAYTDAIAAQLGYAEDWLSWWHYECNLGRNPKTAYRMLGTKGLRVTSIERLATVICWGR